MRGVVCGYLGLVREEKGRDGRDGWDKYSFPAVTGVGRAPRQACTVSWTSAARESKSGAPALIQRHFSLYDQDIP